MTQPPRSDAPGFHDVGTPRAPDADAQSPGVSVDSSLPDRAPASLLRRLMRLAFLALALAALAWVVAPIVTNWDHVRPMLARPALVAALVLGGVAYGACLWLFMAPGWWWLTRLYGRTAPPLPACAVWCRTQIVKYLPGNVAHYLGRQVLGRRIGLHHAEMAGASLLELVSILGAAALIGVLGLVLDVRGAGAAFDPVLDSAGGAGRLRVALPILGGLVVVGLLAWPLADAVARRIPKIGAHLADLPRLSPLRSLRLIGPALLIHVAFLSITGLILWALCLAVTPEGATPPSPERAIWVYAVAWALGTIAPGAPAGAGVREAILTYELASDLGRPEAAAIALALRLVTTLGDVLAFGASLGVRMELPPEAAPGRAD